MPEGPSNTAPPVEPPAAISFTGMPNAHADLRRALAAFRSTHADGVYSAQRMISPLLDVWALAAAVDRTAARPLEAKLRTLVEREVVTSAELGGCIDLVEAALAPLDT